MPTDTPDRHTEIAAHRTAEAAERTKETATRTAVAAQRTEASADRRTELAANRTVLAAERTYAAWVRTGLVSLAAGVGAKKTLDGVLPEWVIVLTGSVPPCCMDRGCGRTEPDPCSGLCDADVLRAPQLQHSVQNVGRDGHLARLSPVRLRTEPLADDAFPS
jgi:hypothetical protein